MMQTKTALVLGGGGARGAYEIGVWQALRELDITIDMVTGTSVGALNGAVVVQDAFDPAVELWKELTAKMVFGFDLDLDFTAKSIPKLPKEIKELIARGGADFTELHNLLSRYLDENKIRTSSVDFGIVTVETTAHKPQCLWKNDIPKGQLMDYILASASCFPAVQRYQIGSRKFIDGAYHDNVPVGMALQRGATDIIAVDLDSIGIVHWDDFMEAAKQANQFILLKSEWDMGSFLTFDSNNSKRLLRLGYLETLKAWQVFDGKLYTFIKGSMDKRILNSAEQAAALFDIDPAYIYSRDSLNRRLRDALQKYRSESTESLQELKQLNLKNIGQLSNLPSFSQKALTLFIAQKLRDSSTVTPLPKPLTVLLPKETIAARYIAKEQL